MVSHRLPSLLRLPTDDRLHDSPVLRNGTLQSTWPLDGKLATLAPKNAKAPGDASEEFVRRGIDDESVEFDIKLQQLAPRNTRLARTPQAVLEHDQLFPGGALRGQFCCERLQRQSDFKEASHRRLGELKREFNRFKEIIEIER